MLSRTTPEFWKQYAALPKVVQRVATMRYQLWLENPGHPSLQFKKVGKAWSVRVTKDHRALGFREGDTMIWFFIGNHADYDKLL